MTTFCIPADPTDPHQMIIITAARMNFMARSDQQLGGSSKFVIASTRGLSQLWCYGPYCFCTRFVSVNTITSTLSLLQNSSQSQ